MLLVNLSILLFWPFKNFKYMYMYFFKFNRKMKLFNPLLSIFQKVQLHLFIGSPFCHSMLRISSELSSAALSKSFWISIDRNQPPNGSSITNWIDYLKRNTNFYKQKTRILSSWQFDLSPSLIIIKIEKFQSWLIILISTCFYQSKANTNTRVIRK